MPVRPFATSPLLMTGGAIVTTPIQFAIPFGVMFTVPFACPFVTPLMILFAVPSLAVPLAVLSAVSIVAPLLISLIVVPFPSALSVAVALTASAPTATATSVVRFRPSAVLFPLLLLLLLRKVCLLWFVHGVEAKLVEEVRGLLPHLLLEYGLDSLSPVGDPLHLEVMVVRVSSLLLQLLVPSLPEDLPLLGITGMVLRPLVVDVLSPVDRGQHHPLRLLELLPLLQRLPIIVRGRRPLPVPTPASNGKQFSRSSVPPLMTSAIVT